MILCVHGHRPLLPAPSGGAAPVAMRTEAPHGFPSHCLRSSPQVWGPTKDLLTIAQTFHYLETSGWYWGAVSADGARALLDGRPQGTFLLRDSSHPLYMLTLSVMTSLGPTNVRIEYYGGQFRLDSSSLVRPRLLSFPDVLSLVQHYMRSNRGAPSSLGPKDSALLLRLERPLRQPQAFPSLQHLARLAINRLTSKRAHLPLPRPLLLYLQDYPFQL